VTPRSAVSVAIFKHKRQFENVTNFSVISAELKVDPYDVTHLLQQLTSKKAIVIQFSGMFAPFWSVSKNHYQYTQNNSRTPEWIM
jgi:hypothetical protein